MTDDVRRELLDSSAPLYRNAVSTGASVRAAAFLVEVPDPAPALRRPPA
jgi:hypothetical protein